MSSRGASEQEAREDSIGTNCAGEEWGGRVKGTGAGEGRESLRSTSTTAFLGPGGMLPGGEVGPIEEKGEKEDFGVPGWAS